ncbi:uncharacterized protein BT62DRAFT_1011046 [Guyanagaster necrorhizus]|uniref:Uncharacterized protein n=1 Tax=Guyanagaster necrorhizus TaxID=856835 RepID=A0A9P7VKG5_9AGAR|nr:uncharacterized protein BT62DRAFT_1011046 [Guyanagaster necrorhizus MCA 3950]KAG7442005.1 hypothetical protein BT62DRAFT_1011046 [Guyanagaster necrorhizus MCA 3950]
MPAFAALIRPGEAPVSHGGRLIGGRLPSSEVFISLHDGGDREEAVLPSLVHAFIVVVIAISIQLAIQGELVAPLIMRDSSNRIDPSKHDYPDKSALHIYVFPCTTSDTLHLLFIPANRDWSCRRQPGLYVTEKNTPPPVPPDVRRSSHPSSIMLPPPLPEVGLPKLLPVRTLDEKDVMTLTYYTSAFLLISMPNRESMAAAASYICITRILSGPHSCTH